MRRFGGSRNGHDSPLTTSSFYNGHLSETLRRLNELDTPDKASKAAAIRYPKPQSHLHEIPLSPGNQEPRDANAEYLRQLREDLAFELASSLGRVSFPENLTLYNYIDYIFCPTHATSSSTLVSRTLAGWRCSTRHLLCLGAFS
jgi:hypothetical protein